MAHRDDARENTTLKLIASLLTDVANSNCDLRRESPTAFDAVTRPDMTVLSYLTRIRKYTKFDLECFPIALIYLMRLRSVGAMYAVTPHNVHRLLITALLLAAKASDDVYHTNSFMAQCGGIRVQEINHLELEMCTKLHWKVQVAAPELESIQSSLRMLHAELREVLLNAPVVEPPCDPVYRTPSTPAALGATWPYYRTPRPDSFDAIESPPRVTSPQTSVSPRCVIGGSEIGGSEVSCEGGCAADLADLPPCKRGVGSRSSSFGQGLNLLAGKLHRTQWSRWVPGM